MEDILFYGHANGHYTVIKQYDWSTVVEQKLDNQWIEVYRSVTNVVVNDDSLSFKVLAGWGDDPEAGKVITWATRKLIQL